MSNFTLNSAFKQSYISFLYDLASVFVHSLWDVALAVYALMNASLVQFGTKATTFGTVLSFSSSSSSL